MNIAKSLALAALTIISTTTVQSQVFSSQYEAPSDTMEALAEELLTDTAEVDVVERIIYASLTDSLLQNVYSTDQVVSYNQLPRTFFLPAVYNTYILDVDDKDIFTPDYSGDPSLRWLEDLNAINDFSQSLYQRLAIKDASALPYNITMLPAPPKKYDVVINPDNYTINVVEKITPIKKVEQELVNDAVDRKHWLNAFTGNLQFSQAYVSPNWYQGGNNNLNMLLNLNYNIKLNQKFHPNYLFETNFQYKLGLNSAPDDTIRNYNISEDIFQVNSTFGIKAIKKWYYTVTAQFKTQALNSYTSNTRNLRAAFMSPGELNAGIGMTYNTANAKKTFSFDASISPLSYNLMICTDNRMNKKAYGIDPDKNSVSKYGSSLECKMKLKITSNISLSSRLFGFTDYDRAYADLENTVVFEINRYLTTQIFAHLRYDTNTPYVDPEWHKLQIKEILSMGFTYKFSTI